MSSLPPHLPAFNPSPAHTTLTSTLPLYPTSWMDIYLYTPPSPTPASSWVIATYDPPPTTSPDFSTHELLNIPEHWHRNHDEVMTILEGRMKFWLDGVETEVSEGQDVWIPRGTVHGFSSIRGVKVSFRERTVPGRGTFKGTFFKDLFSQGPPGILHAMRTFSEGDAYAHIPLPWGGLKTLDAWVTHALGALGRMVLPTREVESMVAPAGDDEEHESVNEKAKRP